MKKTALDNWIMRTEALPELTREGLEALQLRRLNETLARVKLRGGAYRDLTDHVDSLADLAALPFTTPDMLAAKPGQFLLTSQSEVSRVISGATSGTTGPAKRVFYTAGDTEHTVAFFAAGISEMLCPGERCLIAFPFTGPFGLGDLIAQAVEQLGGIPIRAGFGQPWGELISLVKETRPETYIGFPAALLTLARVYGEDFPIRRALVSADACPAGVMAALEAILGNPLYPHYGSRECGLGGAVTCEAFQGMHLRENHILAEIVDEAGNVLPEGAWGELVITTIGLEAMPLIRYRTGDYTRFLPPCPCGGVSRRIDAVFRREGAVSMEALDSALFAIPTLADYRAGYDGTLTIEALLTEAGDGREIEEAAKALYPSLEVSVATRVFSREDRPLYPGKRQVFASIAP